MSVQVGKKVPGLAKLGVAPGEKLVVYFYPKDMTSGCTLESQNFRDLNAQFRKAKTRIVGVSRDSVASHEKFKAKEKLPFDLYSDADEALCKAFDVIHEKSLYGRKYLGIVRSTFLIDDKGVLRQEWRNVKVPGHADQVLEAARAL